MVFREQCVNGMEGEGITVVDSWKTYVLRTVDVSFIYNFVGHTAGAGKSTLLYVIVFWVLFEVIHRAY